MTRIKFISGDEWDALTKGGRRVHEFAPGDRSRIKRKYRRRERGAAFHKISEGLTEVLEIARGEAEPARLHVPNDD